MDILKTTEKIARLFVFTIRRDERPNANNITLFKNQFYKHNQINKDSNLT